MIILERIYFVTWRTIRFEFEIVNEVDRFDDILLTIDATRDWNLYHLV